MFHLTWGWLCALASHDWWATAGSMPAELVKRYRPQVKASRSNILTATVIVTSAIQMYFKFLA